MNKMKKKKNLILIVSLLLVTVVGVTFALFYTNTSLPNIFGLGNYNVVTSETFTSPASWQPGQEIAKSITATNNGDVQAAFRVKYTEQWLDSNNNDITATVPEGTVSINFINNHDWSYNPIDGYYYYNWIIDSGDTTSSLISGITLNQDLTGSANCVEDGNTYNCSSSLGGFAGATYILTFTKETVVYSKYQSFWNTNQNIREFQYLYTLPEGRTVENLQVGDEICINGATSECFNFVRYDANNNIVMLAKYNLNVGDFPKDGVETFIQDSEMLGFYDGEYHGVVPFAADNYWTEFDSSSNNYNLKSEYGSSYPVDVYDSSLVSVPNLTGGNHCFESYYCVDTPGYSIAYYVEHYGDILRDYGASLSDIRLLTYNEASIGCESSPYNSMELECPDDSFITNTTYWLGTASDAYDVYFMFDRGTLVEGDLDIGGDYAGARPVVVVSKNEVDANTSDDNKFH